jgi:WD40 repeat protein
MELVSGVPITEYCDRQRLSVRARLDLFVAVCQAVQHAHQKGIIHRDLKPSNVLVTEVDGRPTPKVIDFGVAKATEFKLTDQSLVDSGAIVGTPVYMSPEQADPSSMDIDTRTDVYALGVILYELLAGSPPIDPKQFQRGAFFEMLRMVREVDPPKPSTKVRTAEALPSIAASRDVDPEQLKRALRGDLDWIVMKALEKDRTRRYETANGFAADVLRHLAYEPVQAAPPSRGYRLHKFARKHRGSVIAASLIVVALLAGIAGTSWGLFRADQRRAEAEKARAAEAERVKERDAAVVRATDAKRIADARADEINYRLGVSDMVLASAAYEGGNDVLAAERLSSVPPRQRGWEWYYLRRLTCGGLFTLYGHTDWVNSVAFSPDGGRIVTGSLDQTARLWDAQTGTPLLELKGHTGFVRTSAFSPDGTRILTGSDDGTARVWDARTGALLLVLKGRGSLSRAAFSPDSMRIFTDSNDSGTVWDARTGVPLLELKGYAGAVSCIAFSPDGERVVTGGAVSDARGQTIVWDARAGTRLLQLEPHAKGVVSVAFSPDGTRIATGSLDQTARVWDARTGATLVELKGHTGWVMGVAFSPDGTRIVTGSEDRTARVWDARSGAPLLKLSGHTGEVRTAVFSPDGTRVLTGSDDQTAKVWDARSETPPIELRGHSGRLNVVAVSPDGQRILAGSNDGTVTVWDAQSGAPLLEMVGHTGAVTDVAFSTDGARVVTSGGAANTSGEVKVWDARSGVLILKLEGHTAGWWSLAFSPDGTRIVAGRADGAATVWDARSGKPLLELKGHTGAVTSVAFSPNGTRIVTGSAAGLGAGQMKVWDAAAEVPLLELEGHTSAVTGVSFSPDSTRILTNSGGGTARVWDAGTGARLLELEGYTGAVTNLPFSPDGTRFVTGGGPRNPGDVTLRDARTGTPLLELKGHAAGVAAVAFSRNGMRIVAVSTDRTARVWDLRPASPSVELRGHRSWVRRVAFSPDGTRVVTGSDDQTARVWDARTGTSLLELKGHTGWLSGVAFSPDGTRIITGSLDQTARVWDAQTGTPLLELKHARERVRTAWPVIPSGITVAFSADGARIVTEVEGQTAQAKVWDAPTGQELVGVPMPPTRRPGQVSPDGRWIAHRAGNRVDLIPLQPDEQELSYRRLLMQPNYELYREGYLAAAKGNDEFVARFYLNLFPPPERAPLQAEAIVAPLFVRLLVRDDVLAALKAKPAANSGVQDACLKLAGIWPESASAGEFNSAAWDLVAAAGQVDADYKRGLRLAKAACRLRPESAAILNALGVAQYRCGLMGEALATMTRANALNKGKAPSDLAFLALAQHRVGQSDQARDTLRRLREVMKDPQWSENPEARAFLHEAETIELDRAFPADPFAQ